MSSSVITAATAIATAATAVASAVTALATAATALASAAATDVKTTTDDDMYVIIAKKLGRDHLFCSHCHCEKPLQNFASSLIKHFKDGDLTRIPKTCDKMQEINKRYNTINNAINNTRTSIKRHTAWLAEATDDTERAKLQAKLDALQVKLDTAKKAKDAYLAANPAVSYGE